MSAVEPPQGANCAPRGAAQRRSRERGGIPSPRGSTSRNEHDLRAASGPGAARLASRAVFLDRFRRGAAYASALIAVSLAIGMIGYHALERMSWLDAFHQSALLLSGVGSAVAVTSAGGKIFDAIYALFCGVILLAATGLMFAPVIHRLLHRFHLEDARDR